MSLVAIPIHYNIVIDSNNTFYDMFQMYNLKPSSTYSIGVLSKTASYGQTNMIYVTTISSTNSTTKPAKTTVTTDNNDTTNNNITGRILNPSFNWEVKR